jgi:hypothetical protein
VALHASRSNSAFRIKAVCFPRVDFPNQLGKSPRILVTAAPVQVRTEQFPSTPAWFWKLRNQNQSQNQKKNLTISNVENVAEVVQLAANSCT